MTQDSLLETRGDQYQSTAEAIVRTAAAVRNEDIDDLDPLYDAIDPDALESLCGADTALTVTFDYVGLTMRIDSGGGVCVEEACDSVVLDANMS